MLIPDWRAAHRLWSVRLAALGSLLMTALLAFPGLWADMPADVRAILPARLQALVPLLLFAATVIARLVQQPAGAVASTSSPESTSSTANQADAA